MSQALLRRPGDIRDLAVSTRPDDPFETRRARIRDSARFTVSGVVVRAERPMVPITLWRVDVGALIERVYSEFYAERCMHVAREHGRRRYLNGNSSSSRGEHFGDNDVHSVMLATGTEVQEHLPWLTSLYRGPFLELVNRLMGGGRHYVASTDPVSAVNLNLLHPGERYEWHVDTNALTGLLFCSGAADDSELVFQPPARGPRLPHPVVERPAWGRLLLFDAREAPHCVRNVRADRVTVPMNFELAGVVPARPPDLDRYLYG